MHGRHNLYLHSRLPELHNSHSFCAFPVASEPRESVLHKPLSKQLSRDRLLRLSHHRCTPCLHHVIMLTIKAVTADIRYTVGTLVSTSAIGTCPCIGD